MAEIRVRRRAKACVAPTLPSSGPTAALGFLQMPTPRTHAGLSCAAPMAQKVESWRGEKRYEMQRRRLLEI
jgi:hypothetical protein